MLSPKTIDAKFLTTLVGAGVGASALEGDGNLPGAAIGLGVGAYVGSQIKLDLPKTDRYMQRNQRIKITNKPVSDFDTLKKELKSKIKKSSEGFEFLPDNSSVDFDANNPFKTLTNNNIGATVDSSTSLSELKIISSILKNENNIEKVDADVFTDILKAQDDISRSTKKDPKGNKVGALRKYFSEQGYVDEDLDKKVTLFSGNINKDTSLVINRSSNVITIGSSTFKIPRKSEDITSYASKENYSTVNKVNPFAEMYLKSKGNIDGRAIAQALGINFADAAREEAVSKQIEEFAKRGASPEDLKALLLQSSSFKEKDIDSFIAKSYQHLERESGLRAMGLSQKDIDSRATNSARNLSGQTFVGNVFNLDENRIIKSGDPFRRFSTTAYSSSGSELQQYQNMIAKDLNLPNPQVNVKSGRSAMMNLGGSKERGLNGLAPSERSPTTTGSRDNPIYINKNSKNKVVQAMGVLQSRGLIPEEYSTSSAVSRITTNKDDFNLLAKHLYPNMTASLSDGSSIGSAKIRSDYAHSSYKKYDIFSKDSGKIALSSEIAEHITARTNLGISFDAPEINTKSYTKFISKLERLKVIEENSEASNFQNSRKFIGPNLENYERKAFIDLKDNRKAQTNLRATIELGQRAAKAEIQESLTKLDPNSGDAKALNSILTAMNSDVKLGSQELDNYRNVANKKFKAGTIIGLNPNGSEERLSKEFDNHKLVRTYRSEDANSNFKSSFVFRGIKNTGEDEVVKDFGVSAKVVVNNVKESQFDLSYGIAQVRNKNPDYKIVESSDGESIKVYTGLKDANGKDEIKSLDAIKAMIAEEANKAKSSGVGMITSTEDAGQKLSTEVYQTLNRGGTMSEIKSLPEPLQIKLQEIADNIETDVRKLALNSEEDVTKAIRGRNWSLGQLATSLTEGKATSESVMGLSILGQKNLSNLIDTIDLDPKLNSKNSQYAVSVLSEAFGSDLVLDSLQDTETLRTNALNLYLDKVEQVKGKYSVDNIGKSVATGDIYGEDVQKVFNLAYMKEGESTHIGSSDIDTIMRLGSGSRGKSLSHSAQLYLKMAGYTTADLELMGSNNAQDVYDLKFSAELGRPVEKSITINSFLDTLEPQYKSDFLETIGRLPPEKIDEFLINEKVPEAIRNQDFLYYEMENKNSKNIKTIPIHKAETKRVGTYELDNGAVVFKPLRKEVRDLIAADQALSLSGSNDTEYFEKSVVKLSDSVNDFYFSKNNPQLKSTLSLEVPNSLYGLSRQTSNKDLNSIVQKYAKEGKSVIGANREAAMDFLKGQGIDVNSKTLDRFINPEGLLMTELDDGSLRKSIFLQNREPAQSANSIRPTYMKVMDKSFSTKDGDAFIYHGTKDKHYVELMFGDDDGDNTAVYSDKRKLTVEEYESKKLKLERSAINRNYLIELNEDLKIKGVQAKEVPLYSMDRLISETRAQLPELGFADNSPEFYEHLATKQKERMFQGNIKGGVVKSASPGVTQLAMGLAESAFQMERYQGNLIGLTDREAMGTLGHALVENLLKTKHTDTGEFAKTSQLAVESLTQAREKYATYKSEDNLKNYKKLFNSQMELLIPDTEKRKKYQTSVDMLFQADVDNIKSAKERPSNAMHLGMNANNIKSGGLDKLADFTEDVVTSRNTTNISQLATEELDINVERSLKVSYNDLLSNGKQNLLKNKFPLMAGAGALALGALITQKDPNFKPSKKARADTGSMMLAPNVVSQEQSKQSDPMILQNLGRVATDYINPETSLQDISHSVKQAVRIQGSYNNYEADISHSMKEAIFGNNVSNVRIERAYD